MQNENTTGELMLCLTMTFFRNIYVYLKTMENDHHWNKHVIMTLYTCKDIIFQAKEIVKCASEKYRWHVNFQPDNGWVPLGNKPLHEPTSS